MQDETTLMPDADSDEAEAPTAPMAPMDDEGGAEDSAFEPEASGDSEEADDSDSEATI